MHSPNQIWVKNIHILYTPPFISGKVGKFWLIKLYPKWRKLRDMKFFWRGNYYRLMIICTFFNIDLEDFLSALSKNLIVGSSKKFCSKKYWILFKKILLFSISNIILRVVKYNNQIKYVASSSKVLSELIAKYSMFNFDTKL